MIGRIAGTILQKQPPYVLIDVNGIGYELDVPMSTFYGLPAVGEKAVLLTHFLVREDAQLLYGFASPEERLLFRSLLKVSGVGAKVALSILSGLSVADFLQCIANKDPDPLVRVPGIGKKTAERLVVEMQGRADLQKLLETHAASSAVGNTASVASAAIEDDDGIEHLAEQGLVSLGYKPAEAKKMIQKHASEAATVEEMIKRALQGSAR